MFLCLPNVYSLCVLFLCVWDWSLTSNFTDAQGNVNTPPKLFSVDAGDTNVCLSASEDDSDDICLCLKVASEMSLSVASFAKRGRTFLGLLCWDFIPASFRRS